MTCGECGAELPKAYYERQRHTCTCGRPYVAYCLDWSSTWPRYRWTAMPKGGGYSEHPGLPGVPIVEAE